MNAPRFVRGTKSRLFLYLGALSFVGFVVYVYHGAQIQLDDVRQASEKCQQQQESLSAQLQVIFEYKLRLEKSLQQEKNDHRQSKDELQSKFDEEKALKDKELLESMNKYTSLQQQHKILKSQHDDLDDECSKVRILQLQGLEEKSTLEGQVQAVQQELTQIQAAREKELEDLKSSYMQLETELEKLSKLNKELAGKSDQATNRINYLQKQNNQLERELTKTQEQYKTCQRHEEIKVADPSHVILEKPKAPEKIPSLLLKPKTTSPSGAVPAKADQLAEPDKEDKAGSKSTTPQINPDAIQSQDRAPSNVIPMPPPRNALPAGVVPAPNDFENDRFKNNAAENEEAANEIGHAGNFNGNQWGWNYRQPDHQQIVQDPREVIQNHPDHRGVVPNHQNQQEFVQHHPNQRGIIVQNHLDPREMNRQDPRAINHQDPRLVMQNHQNRGMVQQNHQEGRGVVDNRLLNQHDSLLRFQDLNQHNNAAQQQRLADDLEVQRARHVMDAKRNGAAHEIPRNPKNAYAYNNGEYENEAQKNDLQLEEAEEDGDDDVDQINYNNEGGKQNVQNHVADNKRKFAESRDGVMVHPK